jgi:hypothetical protein
MGFDDDFNVYHRDGEDPYTLTSDDFMLTVEARGPDEVIVSGEDAWHGRPPIEVRVGIDDVLGDQAIDPRDDEDHLIGRPDDPEPEREDRFALTILAPKDSYSNLSFGRRTLVKLRDMFDAMLDASPHDLPRLDGDSAIDDDEDDDDEDEDGASFWARVAAENEAADLTPRQVTIFPGDLDTTARILGECLTYAQLHDLTSKLYGVMARYDFKD